MKWRIVMKNNLKKLTQMNKTKFLSLYDAEYTNRKGEEDTG